MTINRTLKNGATLLRMECDSSGEGTVLALRKLKLSDEFVTWRICSEGHTSSGHYFGTDRAAALENYYKRIG